VALKVHRARGGTATRRFDHEARLLGKSDSPHVVGLQELGTTSDGRRYMVMPFVPGPTLRAVIDAEAPIGPLRAARLMGQVARALEALHAAGVVHLDLKPTNIIVTRIDATREHATIVDFGIALDLYDEESERLRVPGAGTPGYISPEQSAGEALGTRADLWSLGVVLHEMLTGERILHYDDARAAIEHVRHGPIRSIRETHAHLRVPEALDSLVATLLSEDPAVRPDAATVRAALEEVGGIVPPSVPDPREEALPEPASPVAHRRLASLLTRTAHAVQAAIGVAASTLAEPLPGEPPPAD
jgi:serine/threonine protein kinase